MTHVEAARITKKLQHKLYSACLQISVISSIYNHIILIATYLSVPADNFGWIAGKQMEPSSLTDYLCELNLFAESELQDYSKNIENFIAGQAGPGDHWGAKGGYHHPQPGSRLLQFGMGALPGRIPNKTVVYSSYIDPTSSRPMIPERYL